MISKRHIEDFFKSISSVAPSGPKGLDDPAWLKVYDYIVQNYHRLDKGARIFADSVFHELDGTIQKEINALPEGSEKRTCRRKLSILRGERPPIAVLYLDTPALESLIRFRMGQPVAGHIKILAQKIKALVKARKLICPENTFHRETLQQGGPQAQEGFDIIRQFSTDLSFRHRQTIEDAQVFRAVQAYINRIEELGYRHFWKDAFTKRTVLSILKKRAHIVFHCRKGVTENGHSRVLQQGFPQSARLRIRIDALRLKEDRALLKQSARQLRDLVRLGMKFRLVKEDMSEAHMDAFWTRHKTDLPVILWNHFGGKPAGLEGLVFLYESEVFKNVPTIKVRRDIWNAFSACRAQRRHRVTAPSDIAVLSAVLPYTDMAILGPRMTHVVRDVLQLHATFDTKIFSADEHEQILAALYNLPWAG
jgi:hypothetical protein